MPTYEYACRACGFEFEEIQKMSDPPIEVCPKCGAKSAQRLISQGNFILKGGGWYTTGGYGTPSKEKLDSLSKDTSKGDAKSSESKSSESKGSESKGTESKGTESKSSETKSSETKTDTKTETKAEPKKDSSGSSRSGSSSSHAA